MNLSRIIKSAIAILLIMLIGVIIYRVKNTENNRKIAMVENKTVEVYSNSSNDINVQNIQEIKEENIIVDNQENKVEENKTKDNKQEETKKEETKKEETKKEETKNEETKKTETKKQEIEEVKNTTTDTKKTTEETSKKKSGKIVVIDPGHQTKGDNSKEPIGPGATEKKAKVTTGATGISTKQTEAELNLKVSLLLRTELQNRGYKVIMTRKTGNVNISNSERAAIANNANADAFVRIHADSVDSSKVVRSVNIMPNN